MRFANEHGFCELNPFPGCKWMCVSNAAYVYPDHRGQGFGKNNHLLRIQRAKEMGYNFILCTVSDTNEAEKKILIDYGWFRMATFTTHDKTSIGVWGRSI